MHYLLILMAAKHKISLLGTVVEKGIGYDVKRLDKFKVGDSGSSDDGWITSVIRADGSVGYDVNFLGNTYNVKTLDTQPTKSNCPIYYSVCNKCNTWDKGNVLFGVSESLAKAKANVWFNHVHLASVAASDKVDHIKE